MSKKDSCNLYPEINGKPSKTYKKLVDDLKVPRSRANYIYVYYLSTDMADKMDQAGFKTRTSQGEHKAEDILKFIKYHEKIEPNISNLTTLEANEGITDANGKRVDFYNAEAALKKADEFNNKYEGLAANVYKYGDVYNVVVQEKNSRTHMLPQEVKEKLAAWGVYKQYFRMKGLDLDTTPIPQEIAEVFSAYNIDLAEQMRNLHRRNKRYIYKQDALSLFFVHSQLPQVRALVGAGAFSSIEDAAQAWDDIRHGIGNYTPHQKILLDSAMDACQNNTAYDFAGLKNQIAQMTQNVRTNMPTPEEDIENKLKELNKKYGIEVNEVHKLNSDIKTLSDAVAESIFNIKRQIRDLERKGGITQDSKKLRIMLNELMKELEGQKYGQGLVSFLQEAEAQVSRLDAMLARPYTGDDLQKMMEEAKVLKTAKDLIDQYRPLVIAISKDTFTINGKVSQTTINDLKTIAKRLDKYMEKKQNVLDERTLPTIERLVIKLAGSEIAPNGQLISELVRTAAADSSFLDRFLYSMGRSSNVVVAAMGKIVENAQMSRDKLMNEFDTRINRATHALFKAGFNTSFMYEEDGHIISDIDWKAYEKAKWQYKRSLLKQHIKGLDLEERMVEWEEQNTMEREVDKVNHRTERVPNTNYRKPFPTLSKAQKDYYDEIMQIKGEIGTLLPDYAQNHYLPPQIRRNTFDALGKARSAKDIYKAVRNKVQDFWTIREDDTNYAGNAVVDGTEYEIVRSGQDDTPIREIPIFYIKPVEQAELLREFSSALTALAGQAVNYDAMNNVVDTVEFMANFVRNQDSGGTEIKGDMVSDAGFRVIKRLKDWELNSTSGMVDAFLSWHFYGQKRKISKKYQWVDKAASNLIKYTSFKGLTSNLKGMVSNYLVGEFQMMVEAGAGEFYGFKNYLMAHKRLFLGSKGAGVVWDTVMETKVTKATLFMEMFDPEQENFSSKSHRRYHKNLLRKLLAHDLSIIGYKGGEFLMHLVNLYAILDHEKVYLNGKKISLYEAFERVNDKDGVAELKLKNGVTDENGNPITEEYIEEIRNKVAYVNETTHGAMSEEKKGLIHRYWLGRMAMNFRQWMVEHYSRRFRGRHKDSRLKEYREGYYVSVFKLLFRDEDMKEAFEDNEAMKAFGIFLKNLITFIFRAQGQWKNLDKMQRYNVKRAWSEMMLFLILCGLSMGLGEPDEHKGDWARRFWILIVKRLLTEEKSSIPGPWLLDGAATLFVSPMAGINVARSVLYIITGIFAGDPWKKIKTGRNAGQNKYWRNIEMNVLPYYKDYEQMKYLGIDPSLFTVFSSTPSNR